MALTVTSAPTLLNDKYAIGSRLPSSEVVVAISSDVSLTGDEIFINPGIFVDSGGTISPNLPSDGFGFTYPTLPGIYPLSEINNAINAKRQYNIEVIAEVISDTEFRIRANGLFTSDLGSIIDSISVNSNNQGRFTRNSVNSAVLFDNNVPSVYNDEKVLSYHIWHKDGATINTAIAEVPITARFWESGILGAPAELQNWTCWIERNGQVVNDFNIYQDVDFVFRFDAGINTIPGAFNIGIINESDATNQDYYYSDLSLNYAFVNNSGVLSDGLPTIAPSTAFISALPITNTIGNVYEGRVTIDKDHFDAGKKYRVFVVANGSGVSGFFRNSKITNPVIVSDGPPDVTTGTVNTEVQTYDFDSTTYNTNCIDGIAPGERVRICVKMDEDEYNDAIFTNNVVGTFSGNLVGIGNSVVNALPPQGVDLGAGIEIPFVTTFTPDCDAELEFRVPESWAGITKYIVFRYQFAINIPGAPYSDFIYHPVKLTVNSINDGGFSLESISFENGDPVGDTICNDRTELIDVCFRKTSPDDYSVIPIVRPLATGGGFTEESFYDNDNLDPRDIPFVVSGDDSFGDTLPDLACFKIDPSLLPIGEQYRVCLISKRKLPPVSSCVPIPWDLITTHTTLDVSPNPVFPANQRQVKIRFDYDATASPVPIIGIFILDSLGNQESFTTPTGSYEKTFVTEDPSANISYVIYADIGDVCTYSSNANPLTHDTCLEVGQPCEQETKITTLT